MTANRAKHRMGSMAIAMCALPMADEGQGAAQRLIFLKANASDLKAAKDQPRRHDRGIEPLIRNQGSIPFTSMAYLLLLPFASKQLNKRGGKCGGMLNNDSV